MAITAGASLNTVPSPYQSTLSTNYIDFRAGGTAGWAQQYLPDLMEKEAEVFGNRTIGGFLQQVGAEEAMTSDQVVWSEQGRLHLSYIATMSHVSQKADATAGGTITIVSDIDGNTSTDNFSDNDHGIRVNDMLLMADANTTVQGVCTAVNQTTGRISVGFYGANTATAAGITATTASALRVLVYGSEYAKGVAYNTAAGTASESRTANEPQFTSFSNKPIIMKDFYHVSGSDTAQIGWVETTGEDGQTGYMWYLKAEGETRMRFSDYMEMAMIESISGTAGSTLLDSELYGAAGNTFGTEGLFEAVSTRGNSSSGITGVNCATDLAEFDAILAEFDNQGAIEENMLFVNRTTALAVDDMLACMNSYGAGGTSYGVFSNSEDMALNLGFSGFRRGSYDFYKTDWKYLNDKATRGGINAMDTVGAIRGIIVPAGVSSVYDQQLGRNLKRPFLHVRYRASQTDDRYFKTWVTGAVGAATSSLDAMEIHYLSERCLITQGANNFMLLN
jgi:hypothetical protein